MKKIKTKQLKADIKKIEAKMDRDLFKLKFYIEDLFSRISFKKLIPSSVIDIFWSARNLLFPKKNT